MNPIDYTMDVLNPIEGALRGYSLGREDIQNRQIMQERSQNMGIQRQNFADQQQALQEQRAAAAQQREQAVERQARLSRLQEMAANGTLTAADISQSALQDAKTFEEFGNAFKQLSEPVQKAQTQFAIGLSTALVSGNPQIGINLLDERIQALKNTGTPEANEEANRLEIVKKQAVLDPKVAGFSTIYSLRAQGVIDDKALEFFVNSSNGNQFRPATAEEAERYGAKSGQIDTKTGEFKATGDKGPLVQNVMGDQETEAAKELGKGQAKQIIATLEAGDIAARNLAELDRLEGLLENVSTGSIAAIKQWFGSIGIATEGVEDIQGVAASIARMIPKQREAGSGSSSNLDVQTFALALPSLINQPGGNKIIVETMRAIAEYDVAASIIAGQVSDYLTTPADERKALEDQGLILSPSNGRKAVRELGNPTSIYKEWASSKKGTPTASGDAKANFMADPRVQALAPPEREKAWNIYQQKVGK